MDLPQISTYPSQIVGLLRQRWEEHGFLWDDLADNRSVGLLLDTMYQASLLREEGEPVRCRMILCRPQDFSPDLTRLTNGNQVYRFSTPSRFTPHDVRKLAAAAGYFRSMLGVEFNSAGEPEIWGMVVTGTAWVNQIEGGRASGVALPQALVLHALGPGHLIAAAGHVRVLESVGGKVLTDVFDPFASKWLPRHFAPIRSRMMGFLQERLQRQPATEICDSFVKDVAQGLVRRVLSLVRSRGHGGMLVYVPEDFVPQISQWFRFRVRLEQDDATFQFRELMILLLKRVCEVAESQNLGFVRYDDYQKMQDSQLSRIDNALVEFSHFLADLMSVDGSLVLDVNFRLIGFGGEILGDSHVSYIERALDLEAERSVTEAADDSGTRHRSAYRLVSGLRNAIAVVCSQDGAVRFVSYQRDRLTYWPYLP